MGKSGNVSFTFLDLVLDCVILTLYIEWFNRRSGGMVITIVSFTICLSESYV